MIFADNSVVRGLVINRFTTKLAPNRSEALLQDGDGIVIQNDDDVVEGCFLGTDATGTIAEGNEFGGVLSFGSNSTIGGTDPADRNLISGNAETQVGI